MAHGLAIAPDGQTIYVADSDNRRIQAFTPEGTLVRRWGSSGTGDGQFDKPGRMAVGPDGMIYVSDYYNFRVQFFDASRSLSRPMGKRGRRSGPVQPSGRGSRLSRWQSCLRRRSIP